MNILFVTVFQISEQKGGTERTTARISNEMRRRGHKCYNLYAKPIGDMFEMTEFDGIYTNYSPESVRDIIDSQQIDKIILEGAFIMVKNVYDGRAKASRKPSMYLFTILLQVMSRILTHFILYGINSDLLSR